MPKYKNTSRGVLSLIYKGRKIRINPGQVIDGPETFNMYKDLKKVDDKEVDRYNKAVTKVMKYNPTEAKKLNLNVETFTKVNDVVNHTPLKENEERAKDVIRFIDGFIKSSKPSVSVVILGNELKFNKQLDQIKKVVEYSNVEFYNNADINKLKTDFVIVHDSNIEVKFDYVSDVVKLGVVNSVDLPRPYKIDKTNKEWLRNDIKNNYTKKIKADITLGTLSHNERQYKDFIGDIAKQRTDKKIEMLVAPNYSNVYNSCSEALNILKFLSNAPIVNLCHQDLRCQPHWIQSILEHTKQLNARKIKWGVLGMAGSHLTVLPSNEYNVLYLGDGQSGRSFSSTFRKMYGSRKEVQCIDELSLIVKQSDPIWFDEKTFDHYHYYGSDLCLQYLDRGYKNYAIDAECVHLSDGQTNLDAHKNEYIDHSIRLYKKWKGRFRCWKTTTANFRPDQNLIIPLIFVLINMKRGNKDLPQVIYVK